MKTAAQIEAQKACEKHGSIRAAARALGKNYTSVRDAYYRALRWDEAPPGVQSAMETTGIDAGAAKHGWRVVPREDGGRESVFWKADEEPAADPDEAVASICERLSQLPAAPLVARSTETQRDHLNAILGADLHMGVTIGDYGPDVALERAKAAHMECQEALPPSERTLVVWNGDTTHANDDKDETYRSKHRLKVEGPHHENIGRVLELCAFQIETSLTRSDRVDFQCRPGNHDPSTPSYLFYALTARYGGNERVAIYPSVDWWGHFQWGEIFLALHHGDGNPPKDLAAAVPYLFKSDFAKASRHFLLTAHRHSDKAETFGGLRWRQLPAMTKLDQHADQMGHVDTSTLRAMRFNAASGAFSEYTAGLS